MSLKLIHVNYIKCFLFNPDENQLVIGITSLISSATRQGFPCWVILLIQIESLPRQQQHEGNVEMVNNCVRETFCNV